MKLTPKLVALSLLLLIIPLAIVGFLVYDNGRQSIEQDTLDRLTTVTLLKEAEFNRWLEGTQRSLRDLARRPLVREYAAVLIAREQTDPTYQAAYRSLIEDHLTPILEEEAGFLDLAILRPSDGMILVSNDEELEGKYRESEPFFLEGKRHTYVQNVEYVVSLGQIVMHVSTPSKDKDGNLIAVLAGHLDLAEMSEIMMQRSGLNATEETYLVNEFNFLITESRFEPGRTLKKAIHTVGVEACLEHNDGIGFYDDYRGVPVIGVYRWIPERELCILTEVDQAEAYAPIQDLRNKGLGLSAVVGLITGVLTLVIMRRALHPIEELAATAEAISAGDLSRRAEVNRSDELGTLANAFNTMATRLQEMIGSLEQRVAERTQELLAANALLEAEEKALRASEETAQALLNASHDFVMLADPDGTIIALNEVASRTMGRTQERLVGANAFDRFPPDVAAHRKAMGNEVVRSGKPSWFEDKREGRWFSTSIFPVFDAQGVVTQFAIYARDITEHKRAEEALRASEERLSRFMDSATDSFVIYDSELNLVEINEAGLKLFPPGTRKEELIGKNVLEISPELEETGRYDKYVEVLKTGEPFFVEDFVPHPKFGNIHLSVRAFKVGDGLGLVATDITARKQAEEALRENAARYRSLFEDSPTALLELDLSEIQKHLEHLQSAGHSDFRAFMAEHPDAMAQAAGLLRVLNANQASVELFEAGSRERLIAGIGEVFSEETFGVFQELLLALAAGSTHFASETVVQTLTGGKQYIVFTLSLPPDYEDTWSKAFVALIDITDRKRAEEQVAVFRRLADSSAQGFGMSTLEGEITYANPSLCHFLGADVPADVIGQSFFAYTDEELQRRLQNEILPTVMQAGQWVGEVTLRLPDGGSIPTIENIFIIPDEKGTPLYLANVMTDITERKQAERILEQRVAERTQELTRSNIELQQFAYVASHDLQEPLRMVTSYVQLLERRYKGQLDADADEFIAYAVDGATRMKTLIQDLLAYSRVETRGKPFEPTDCEVVLDQVLANLQLAMQDCNAVVTHDPLPTVMADATQLAQLFQNLISNSIKFRSDKPPEIHVGAEGQDGECLFSVRDNGIGIAPEYSERIFVIFQRLHKKEEYSGTGIGLAICKKIVERHGGRIWVDSEPGAGSTFYFTIPLKGENTDVS